MTHDTASRKTLALDLEGTLISNAMSQFPRPGLYEFLSEVERLFARVVLFTAVSTPRARAILELLVDEGEAPEWARTMQIIDWHGEKKDLRFVEPEAPERCLLVDDIEAYVLDGQHSQWIPIEEFGHPYPSDDRELERTLELLRARSS